MSVVLGITWICGVVLVIVRELKPATGLISSANKRLRLFGGSGGRSFITKASRHAGQGGNSKGKASMTPEPSRRAIKQQAQKRGRDPSVDTEVVGGEAAPAQRQNRLGLLGKLVKKDIVSHGFEDSFEDDDYKDDKINQYYLSNLGVTKNCSVWKNTRSKTFIHADFPKTMSRFDSCDFEGKFVMDCEGAPYCGVVCVDLAAGIKPNADLYEQLAGMPETEEEVVDRIGDSDWLKAYAKHRGFNLAINSRHGVVREENPVPGFKWILLDFMGEQNAVGHYRLLVSDFSSGNNFRPMLPVIPDTPVNEVMTRVGWSLLLGALIVHPFLAIPVVSKLAIALVGKTALTIGGYCSTMASTAYSCSEIKPVFNSGPVMCSADDNDRRPVVDRRDKIVHQDTYCVITKDYQWRMLTFFGWCTLVDSTLMPFSLQRKWLISLSRSNQICCEMQTLVASGREPGLALSGISRLREVNTDSNIPNILFSTGEYLKEWSKYLKPITCVTDYTGLVAYNSDPRVIPPADVGLIAANQLLGGYSKYHKTNYVLRANIRKIKLGVKTAVAPLGVLVTDEGPLYPGLFSVTDDCSVLSAAVLRGMSKPVEPDFEVLEDFIRHSHEFLEPFRVHCGTVDEGDVVEYYRHRNRGKKTTVMIERDISEYVRYKESTMTLKEKSKYETGKIFTKFESNIKLDKLAYGKPRAIMMMSQLATMELNLLCSVFDAWNETRFGDYQIKHMNPEEMIQKIIEFTDKDHSVTDYSSFENSVGHMVREIERKLIKGLCQRLGLHALLQAYCQFDNGSFHLHQEGGTYVFASRCSGHYWTSFGNGVINVCIASYCARMKGNVLSIIAEGDDGIVPTENLDLNTVAKLGFEMSSELRGTETGDNDFLRSRWVDGKRFINVGRSLANIFWVKNAAGLKISKQKFLLKSMAQSLWHLSPGHPVLAAAIKRIMAQCSHAQDFKGSEKHTRKWGINSSFSSSKIRDAIVVDETMRVIVSNGGNGFPPICISDQLFLEEQIAKGGGSMYIGRMLDDYDDVIAYKLSAPCHRNRARGIGNFSSLIKALANPGPVARKWADEMILGAPEGAKGYNTACWVRFLDRNGKKPWRDHVNKKSSAVKFSEEILTAVDWFNIVQSN